MDTFFPVSRHKTQVSLRLPGVYAFVVLKKDVNIQEADLSKQLSNLVSGKIAKYACPDFIQVKLAENLKGEL